MLEATFASALCLPSRSSSGSCWLEDVLDGSFLASLFSRSSPSEGCCGGGSCDAILRFKSHKHELVWVGHEVLE